MSFASFRLMQFAVRWYLFGKCTFRTFSYFGWRQNLTANERDNEVDMRNSQSLLVVPPNKKWRISNEAVSLIHSVVSGSWALYTCLVYPQLFDDMIIFWNSFAHYLLDPSTNLLTTNNNFSAVVVCGLLMELNSIFLHSRSLLNLYGVAKTSTAFRIIALINIITFALFRMVISAYLLYWQITSAWSSQLFLGYSIIALIIILSLGSTNTILCYRLYFYPFIIIRTLME
ncbi:unnamed protein product [Anisakis simplex]|uniref:TLC domain-containing protein n=1 Tax=Anisakis simplex TaxID=6269 RepID=A0A3P6QIG5_ANISI|nr:unnamed protein product [Anisakis simplex]